MKISLIAIGDKVMGAADTTAVLLPTFITEGNVTFQLDVWKINKR